MTVGSASNDCMVQERTASNIPLNLDMLLAYNTENNHFEVMKSIGAMEAAPAGWDPF